MDHFFVSSGPDDTGDPDRPGRPRPAPAADTGTAAPADDLRRLPRRPVGILPRPRRPEGGPGERGLGSAMRYRAGRQHVPCGGELLLDVSEGESEGLSASGDGALLLEKGRYLVSFAADAQGEGELGAVLALNGIPLPYTAARLPARDGSWQRLSLTAVLQLYAAALLSVRNNCGGELAYHNAILTAVRLC